MSNSFQPGNPIIHPKQSAWIGIDPGQSGAIAIISSDRTLKVEDFTGELYSMKHTLIEWSKEFNIQSIWIEDINLGGSGYAGVAKIMENKGMWVGLCTGTLEAPIKFVPPKKWQVSMLRKNDGTDTKTRSVNQCMRLFPELNEVFKTKRGKLLDGRSDATLIACYGKKISGGGEV